MGCNSLHTCPYHGGTYQQHLTYLVSEIFYIKKRKKPVTQGDGGKALSPRLL